MLTYGFKNHEEYQNLFGYRVTGDGVKVRKNKILLAFLKNKSTHKHFVLKEYLSSTDLNQLCDNLFRDLSKVSRGCHDILIFNRYFKNNDYQVDEQNGICLDNDIQAYRYINVKTNKPFKMKIAKLFRAIMADNELWRELPEQIQTYMCEKIANDWQAERIKSLGRYSIRVDNDFEKIYDRYYCDGDFDSCMTDRNREDFYNDCINAKAAALINNQNGKIAARCIIYQDVMNDDETKHYRLAERQYATDCDNVLKTILVQKLIEGGYIDGYKKIGVNCHANDAFVLNDGTDLNVRLHIKNTIKPGDILSYQDSFIYLCVDAEIAYNKYISDYTHKLDDTSEYLEGEYDEYHDCYCRDTCEVFVHGRSMQCDADDLSDFIYIENLYEYHHIDDCERCDNCGEWFLSDNDYYSDLTGYNYCCESCMNNAEEEYKSENWYYSDFDEEYFEDEDDITVVYHYAPCVGYNAISISLKSLDRIGSITYNDEIYLEWDKTTGKPFNK